MPVVMTFTTRAVKRMKRKMLNRSATAGAFLWLRFDEHDLGLAPPGVRRYAHAKAVWGVWVGEVFRHDLAAAVERGEVLFLPAVGGATEVAHGVARYEVKRCAPERVAHGCVHAQPPE